MSDNDIILDLGDYGQIAVVPAFEPEGIIPAGVGEKLRTSFEKALRLPLTGLSVLLLDTLPQEEIDATYRLDEFAFEFELGLGVELGEDGGLTGVVAKIMPRGNFKCTYTWKRHQS